MEKYMVDSVGLLLDFFTGLVIICMLEREFVLKSIWRSIIALGLIVVSGTVIGMILTTQYSEPFFEPNTFFTASTNEGAYFPLIKIVICFIALGICCELPIKKLIFSFVGVQVISGVVDSTCILAIPGIYKMFVARKIISLIIITVGGVVAIRGFKININFSEMSKKLLIEMGVLFFSLMAFVVSIVIFINGHGVQNIKQIITLIAIIMCLVIFAIVAEGLMLEMSKMSLEKENAILQRYNEQQKSYYELVLKNEEDTRRFRHDVLNHIMCLENYIDEGDIEQCKKYLSTMTEELNKNRKQLFHTGNKIADVMLTNILANKKEDVKISVTGNLKENLNVEDYDLVVVISNILKNAVEAVNNQSEDSNKFINVNFIVGKKYLRIEEHNSIDANQVESAQKLETTKADKKTHGIGTKNIRRIVEKYDGVFKTEVKEDEFAVIVELSLKKIAA